jgi:glycosyltransferase involved in cell wall biosynthesis
MQASLVEGVSAVIIMENAADILPEFFRNLRGCEVFEVLACDCGSTDASVAIARDNGANLFRAGDLAESVNSATDHARGSALWFLSPYCFPPEFGGNFILDALEMENVVGGHFPLGRRPGSSRGYFDILTNNLSANFRRRLMLEQGPYISHHAYEDIGGFPADGSGLAGLFAKARKKGKLFTMPSPILIA